LAQTQLRERDFLNLGEPEPYLNYGRKEYDPYPEVLTSRNQYDRLGNFLMRGFNVFQYDDVRPGLSQSDRSRFFFQWFNQMVITSDTYRGWDYSLTVGDVIRTKLSDLTLRNPRWDGVRMDLASSDNQATLMYSRGSKLTDTPRFSTFTEQSERSAVIHYGGHWQTSIGDILQLGFTYYNQHMADTYNSGGSFVKGDTPYAMLPPSSITVAIEDDSPEEIEDKAIVYGVDILVVGESRGEELRLSSSRDIPGYQYDRTLVQTPVGGRRISGGREVAGDDRAMYEFKLPTYVLPADGDYSQDPEVPLGLTLKSVRFQVEVEGDYSIGVRQKHLYFDQRVHDKNVDKEYLPGNRRYVNPFTGLSGDDAMLTAEEAEAAGEDVFRVWPVPPAPELIQDNSFLFYKWEQWDDPESIFYIVERSEGKGQGRKIVEFDYGIPTGQALYGADFELELAGFTLNGEFATNPRNYIFPVGRNAGERSSERSKAYFLTGKKSLGSVHVGAELFGLDPDYSGDYDSRRGGIAFFTDMVPPRYNTSKMQEFPLMEDNDDSDQFPDDYAEEEPSGENPDSGIFPGLDENGDLVPDSDQNFNGIPDWEEPVLFYDADPPEFIYGIDFNNNGVVDYRENDNLPDYPYRRGRKGWHVFTLKDDLGRLGKWLSLGGYRMKETVTGNEANALYARWEYYASSPILGQLRINDDIKLVQDEISDDVYIWRDYPKNAQVPHPLWEGRDLWSVNLNSQLFPPTPDPLMMRDSRVNTLFLESHYDRILDLNVINKIQWIRNSQADAISESPDDKIDDVVSTFTMVNKVDYTVRAGELRLRPMFKHLLYRRTSKERVNSWSGEQEWSEALEYRILTPILRVDYHLTPKSSVQLGFQGFPFWRYSYKDLIASDRVDDDGVALADTKSFKQWDLVFMMTNRSDYWGYNVANQIGYARTSKNFDDETQEARDERSSRVFFDIIIGY